ncbi:hypothetical protein Tco_0271270 [Tanacetum coccineum]
MTWHFDNHGDGYSDENVDANGGEMTALNGELSPEKGMLTWMLDSNGERLTAVNGDGELTADAKNMLTWQNDDAKGMLTCQSEFHGDGEAVTNEMLTWHNNEDEEELAKFLEEGEMMTCQKTKVKIINDYPYWLPLKFQTSSAYVTINGNEELCGSSFSDSDTSYMAGISGAWSALADEARGSMEVEWGECEDEMLASFLGEGVGEMRGE